MNVFSYFILCFFISIYSFASDQKTDIFDLEYRSAYLPGLTIKANRSNMLEYAKSRVRKFKENGDIVNTVIFEIKEHGIHFDFNGKSPILDGWTEAHSKVLKSSTSSRAANLSEIVSYFKSKGYRVVLRQAIMRDKRATKLKPEWSILDSETGEVWGKNQLWLNPWNDEANTYNLEIALRALDSGADEIQFDYIRLPDPWEGDREKMDFSGHKPEVENYCEGPLIFLEKAKKEISKRFGNTRKIGIAVFGSVANGRNECEDPERKIYVGQNVYRMAQHVDVIWPMQYPSHWAYKGYKLFGDTEHPENIPAQIYLETTQNLQRQLRELSEEVAIVPWIQSFYIKSFGGLTMEYPSSRSQIAEYTTEQIIGCMEAGCDGFAPWSTSASDIEKALDGMRGFVIPQNGLN